MSVRNRLPILFGQMIVLCLVHASAGHAGNMSFVSDAPIGRFSEDDMKLMNANIESTLADAKVRTVHSWSNPVTNHSGSAETLQAFSGPEGVPCRLVLVANRAGNLKGKGQYTLCKMEGRGWTYVPKDFASPQPSNTDKKD